MPSFRQIRAARALLGWEIIELAKRTGLNRRTLYNIETDRTKQQDASIDCIQKALSDVALSLSTITECGCGATTLKPSSAPSALTTSPNSSTPTSTRTAATSALMPS